MTPQPLSPIHRQLIQQAQAWALGAGFDPKRCTALREQCLLANHAHYLETIPVYQRFAQEERLGAEASLEDLQTRLMLPDEIFKSYNQAWLDAGDFTRMSAWLGEIFHTRIEADLQGVETIDGWIERLGKVRIRLVYSSGTSGAFSFVPRDAAGWELFTTASSCTLAPLLARCGFGPWWGRLLVGPATRLLSPEAFSRVSRQTSGQGFDAFFLDFASGHTGNQTLARELGRMFRSVKYLYQTNLSPTVLRLLARGARNDHERSLLAELQQVVVTDKEANYARLVEGIRKSVEQGQKTFIFGTTQQYMELCEGLSAAGSPLSLRPGSLVLYGGGWKSFSGDRISRDELLGRMVESFGISPQAILEGYSMTEINAFMLRCAHGRFHIPPTVEPVIFDEALDPIHGAELHGIFGFQDALALGAPGFIISGDEVDYLADGCACGLSGPGLTSVGRATAREVKGCGGIMASLRA